MYLVEEQGREDRVELEIPKGQLCRPLGNHTGNPFPYFHTNERGWVDRDGGKNNLSARPAGFARDVVRRPDSGRALCNQLQIQGSYQAGLCLYE